MLGDSVSIEITAPAERLYDLVADVTRTPEHSPETRTVEWLGEPAAPVVGARFRGRNRWRGYTWWREVTILQADRGRDFVFQTVPGRGIYNDTTTWRYRFEPVGAGVTRVTESYEFSAPWWLGTMDRILGRPKALRRGMRQTLVGLAKTASGSPSNE